MQQGKIPPPDSDYVLKQYGKLQQQLLEKGREETGNERKSKMSLEKKKKKGH